MSTSENYLNSFLAPQKQYSWTIHRILASINISWKIVFSFLHPTPSHFPPPQPPKKETEKGKKPFLIIALVQMCRGFHTEWWLPLSPAFVHLLWEEQFTESIIDFCHNRYRDASLSLLSQLTLCITTVRPVCEARHYFFSSKSITGVGEKWWK